MVDWAVLVAAQVKAQGRALNLLAFVLIASLVVRHKGIADLADTFGFSVYAMNYMLDGVLDIVLLGCIAFLVWGYKGFGRAAILVACAVGSLEAAQISGCRFLVSDISKVPAGVNLCDYLAGWNVGHAVAMVYLLIIVWAARNEQQ